MAERPIFPDCAFPEDCQCAPRGYEHTMDGCAVPRVAEAASMFGIDPGKLFNQPAEDPTEASTATKGFFQRFRRPPPMTADFHGTVQPLGSSDVPGDTLGLARDVKAALRAMDAKAPYSEDDLDRLIHAERVSDGLRAEAGMSHGSIILVLHTRIEPLAGLKKLAVWLTLARSEVGDALWYAVALKRRYEYEAVTYCGNARLRDQVCEAVRYAAGGTSGPVFESWTEVPTQEDLRRLEQDS